MGDVDALLASGVLAPVVAAGGDRSLITYYDDDTGERAELSAAELGTWAARTANLLVRACGLGPRDRAAVLLPPHWQTAAVLLGAWAAGVSVDFHRAATAGLPRLGPNADRPFGVAFAALDRIRNILEDVPWASHRFALGPGPGAAPMEKTPDGFRDYVAEVRQQSDFFPTYASIRATDPASGDGTSYAEWAAVAQGVAARAGIGPGDRVLVDATEHEHPLKWLLTPLMAGASVVLCANLDPGTVASRTRAEGVTRVL